MSNHSRFKCAHCGGPFVGTPVTDGGNDPICEGCAQRARRGAERLNEPFGRTDWPEPEDGLPEGYHDAPEFEGGNPE